MKLSEVFPSKYVAAADLKGRDVTVVIASVELWSPPINTLEKPRPGDKKLLIHFQGREKGLICNKTNRSRIEVMYGEETDNWIGQEITLGTEFVDFQGKTMEAIRVQLKKRPVSAAANGPVHTVTAKSGYELSQLGRGPQRQKPIPDMPPDDGDEIPF